MADANLSVNFDGECDLVFVQGEDRTILVGLTNLTPLLPQNLTGATVGINLPRQGGGSIKRTTGTTEVLAANVAITPGNVCTLVDHGLVTGDPVTLTAAPGGTLPGGLAPATQYLIKVLDNNTFQITDTSGNVIALTTQGTVGFLITNSVDVTLNSGDLGQFTFNLRALVSAAVNAQLAQTCQVQYTLSSKTRIALVENLLDVYVQPVP